VGQCENGVGIAGADERTGYVDGGWDERCRFVDSESPELTRDPVAPGNVPASENTHDDRVAETLSRFSQGLRHGAVPRPLSLDETLELGFLYGFRELCLIELWKILPLGSPIVGDRLQRLLREISAGKHALIGRAGRCRIGKTFALRDRNALPALFGD